MIASTSRWSIVCTALLAVAACGGGSSGSGSRAAKSPDAPPPSSTTNSVDCINRVTAAAIEGSGRTVHISGNVDLVNDGTLVVGCAIISTAGASVVVGSSPGSLSDIKAGDIVNILAELDREAGLLTAITIILVDSRDLHGGVPVIRLGRSFSSTSGGTRSLLDGPDYRIDPLARVLVDGGPTNAAGLTIGEGEIVVLAGTQTFPPVSNPGGIIAASALKISHMVDGPLDEVDLTHERMVVLGQTVLLTSYPYVSVQGGTPGLDAVEPGARLVVSGHPTASGEIIATRIAFSAATGDFVVSGIVRSADPVMRRFVLNGVTIDYSMALLSDLPTGVPVDGERVLARVTRVGGQDQLVATSVADDSTLPDASTGTVATLHGTVTSMDSPSSGNWAVDGYRVIIADTTIDSCDFTAASVNFDITVEASIGEDGKLIASATCAWSTIQGQFMMQGAIDGIDLDHDRISILGFTAQSSATTHIIDSTGGGIKPLGDLNIGDWITVYGKYQPADKYQPTPGLVLADTIVLWHHSIPSQVDALGSTFSPDLRIHDPLIYIRGVPISTDDATIFVGITRTLFFHGPRSWPNWYYTCAPLATVVVRVNPDGSLTATTVTVTSMLPMC